MGSVSARSTPEFQGLGLLNRFKQSLQDFKGGLKASTFKHRRANREQSLEDTHAENLFSEIMGLLSSGTTDDKRFLISQCIEVLREPTTEYGIDDCVLYALLMRAIDRLPDIVVDDPEAAKYEDEDAKFQIFALNELSKARDDNIFYHQRNEVILAAMIITVAPHLIFERLESSRSGGGEIENNCSLLDIHTGKSTHKSSPLYKAVQKGAIAVVRCMLHHGGLFCQKQLHLHPGDRRRIIVDTMSKYDYQINSSEDLMVAVLRRREGIGGSRSKYTLLEQAADNGSLSALKTLLEFSPSLAAPPDETFERAQKRWADKDSSTFDIVESFLTYTKCREMFVTKKNILDALDEIEAMMDSPEFVHGQKKSRIPEENLRLVKLLLENVENTREVDYRVTSKIIELDLIELWNENWRTLEHDKTGLLHLAVQYHKPRFVRIFLRKFPDSVTKAIPLLGHHDKEEKFPLWHNNKRIEDSGKIVDREDDSMKWPYKEEIRKALVSATIRQVEIEKLPDIFQRSHQPVHELCFDLPHFNSKKYTISQFVDSLINHQENAELLSYEATIRYAAFPVLDSNENSKDSVEGPRREHTEVFNVLRWLQNSKQVTRIIELIVPDRLVSPHNENRIAKYVKHFKVESLDWRFVDLSISVFSKEVKNELTVLHLYWSGKQAVLSHWLSVEGVWALPKLTKLYIHVVEGFMVQNTFYKVRARLESIFQRGKKDMKMDKLNIDVSRDPWSSTHVVLGDLKEVAEKVVPKLAPFINSYRAYVNKPENLFRPTKVAIIDNGILSMLPGQDQEPRYATLGSQFRRRNQKIRDRAGLVTDKNKTYRPLSRTDSTKIGLDIFEFSTSELSDPNLESEDEDDDEDKYGQQSLGSQRTLWSRIKEGRSFVRDCSRVSPWLFASHPHGTQMANLICALDPLCETYVAKVTDGRHGITASRVAQAIEWAISRDVDIISMSFAILEPSDQLSEVCRKAGSKNIVMLCSAHDEGFNLEEAWPAAHADSWTIAACDNYGKVLHETKQTYDYAIPGVDVRAGIVPFLDSNDRISGSSVATAIAAGLSSLILSCDTFAHPDITPSVRETKRKKRLQNHLKKMVSYPDSKYIMLEKLCDLDRKTLNGDHITASKYISGEWFSHRDDEY